MKREVVEAEVVVVLEVAAGMEVAVEVEAEAGIMPVTIAANQGICQEITTEMGEEGLVEAEVVAEEAAIIVEERDTWLGTAMRDREDKDNLVIKDKILCSL